MKKKIIYLFIMILGISLSGCPEDFGDRFWIFNKSNKDVFCHVAITEGIYNRNCSDTLLPPKILGEILEKNKITLRTFTLEEACDTIRIFILDPDTITAYPWEKIRQENKILKRYDIYKNDLKKINWKVTYP